MSGATQDFMKVMMMGVVTTAVYLTTIWISKGKAQLPVSTFLQSDQVYWRVFAREMHSTSQFDKTILSKCVCVFLWCRLCFLQMLRWMLPRYGGSTCCVAATEKKDSRVGQLNLTKSD